LGLTREAQRRDHNRDRQRAERFHAE
jgi:hypothetical protein